MSPGQISYFQGSLWPAACAAQGWDRHDREFRLEFISGVIGRRIESAKEVEERDEFTLLKNRCMRLADVLQGAIEDGSLVFNQKRNCVWQIHQLEVPAGVLKRILHDRFGGSLIEDLELAQLRHLLFTLKRWTHRKYVSNRCESIPSDPQTVSNCHSSA